MPNNKTKKNMTIILFLSFFLNGYSSGISGISLGSFTMMIIIISGFFHFRNRVKIYPSIKKIYLLLLMYVFFLLFLSMLGILYYQSYDLKNFVLNMTKLLFWVLMIIIYTSLFFDKKIFVKYLTSFGLILTVYIIFQTILFYGLNFYLPNIYNIPFLRPYEPLYADYYALSSGAFLRPGSLLSEPAFYGNIAILALAFELIDSSKIRLNRVIIFSLGIVLSTSSSAIYIMVMIFLFYFLGYSGKIKFKLKQTHIYVLLLMLLFIPVIIYGIYNIELLNQIQYALETSIMKIENFSSSTRIGNSFNLIKYLDTRQMLFGVGVGNEIIYISNGSFLSSIYLNSASMLVFWGGYISLSLFLTILFLLFLKNRNSLVRLLLFIYIIKGFSSGIWFNLYGILFLIAAVGLIVSQMETIYEKQE